VHRLHLEWQRLFAADTDTDADSRALLEADSRTLLDADGARTRALVIEWGRPADWPALGALWQAVQAELGWPAPLIAVNGRDAFQLWVSLAEPVPAAAAQETAQALAARWLPQAPAALMARRLACWPRRSVAATAWSHAAAVPARQPGAEVRWSAFVSPDLAALFGDDPALDIDPGDEAQADLMARHQPISASLWARARQTLPMPEAGIDAGNTTQDRALVGRGPGGDGAGSFPHAAAEPPDLRGPYDDPALFLRAVMNHPAVPLAQRIEAARALLAQAPPRP
jgi:hypothetical protein